MFKRPLIWVLGLILLGEIVAYKCGAPLYSRTALDDFMAQGNRFVSIRGKIENVSKSANGAGFGVQKDELKIILSDVTVFSGDKSYEGGGVIVYLDANAQILAGDLVLIEGMLKSFERPDNPGEFDKWTYYRARGIDYFATAKSISLLPEDETIFTHIRHGLSRLKAALSSSIEKVSSSDDEAGIFKAILLGDRSALPEETYSDFSACGISHILAISGLHLTLIGGAIFSMLKRFHMGMPLAAIISDIFLLLYVIMIDGSVSAWRAYIMFTLSLAAPLVRRTYDLLSALGLSGIILLIGQPLYAIDGSFLLSFSTVAGIGIIFPRANEAVKILLEPRMREWKRTLKLVASDEKIWNIASARKAYLKIFFWEKIFTAFLFSFSVQMMSAPIVALNYYTISPYGILLNLIVIPMMSLAMSSVIFGSICGLLSSVIGMFFIGVAHYFFVWLKQVCSFVARLPGANIVVGKPSGVQLVLFYTLLFVLLFFLERKSRLLLILLAALPMLLVLLFRFSPSDFSINALYVGQGDSSVIFSEGHCVIVDAGSSDKTGVASKVILPFLKSSAVSKIDLIFLSHADDDHINGVCDILDDPSITTRGVAIPYSTSDDAAWDEIKIKANEVGTQIYLLKEGDSVSVGNLDWEVIWPVDENVKSENDTSLVLTMNYKNFTALFPGDIGANAESKLAEHLTHKTYVKCPHHGSKYSSSEAFLQAISPEVVTVSAGRGNRFGHPAAETLSRLAKSGARVFSTKKLGAITTTLNPDGTVTIETYKGSRE